MYLSFHNHLYTLDSPVADEENADFIKIYDPKIARAVAGITTTPGIALIRNYTGHDIAKKLYTIQSKTDDNAIDFKEELEMFVYDERLPHWLEYDVNDMETVSLRVQSVPVKHHVYIVAPSSSSDASKVASKLKLIAAAEAAGKKLRGRALLLLHWLNPNDKPDNPLIPFFNVDPAATHVQVVGADVTQGKKYKMNTVDVEVVGADDLYSFAEDVIADNERVERIYSSGNV